MIFGAKKSSAALHHQHHNLNMHSANNFAYDQQSASSGDYPYQMQRLQQSDAVGGGGGDNNMNCSQMMNGSHTTKNHAMARQDYFSMVVP